MSERSQALAEWVLCAWCWNRLPDEPVRHRGRHYCDERCAGHDSEVAVNAGDDDAPVDVSDYQLDFGFDL